jgi:hypothetical protein
MGGDDDDFETILANIASATISISPGVTVGDDDTDFTWTITGDDNGFDLGNITLNNYDDVTYSIKQVENEPAIYTSDVQREQHEKYPALQKLWDDYLLMYALTKGEPPVV